MSPIRPALLFLCLVMLGVSAHAAPPLRKVPDGTRLSNDLVTPIYIAVLDPAGEGDTLRAVLKDASAYRVSLYAERKLEFDANGEAKTTLRLFLHQPGDKPGSTPIEPKSSEEKSYLKALEVGLENYAPGWTQNWSIEGHRELAQLVRDLSARQNAR